MLANPLITVYGSMGKGLPKPSNGLIKRVVPTFEDNKVRNDWLFLEL